MSVDGTYMLPIRGTSILPSHRVSSLPNDGAISKLYRTISKLSGSIEEMKY